MLKSRHFIIALVSLMIAGHLACANEHESEHKSEPAIEHAEHESKHVEKKPEVRPEPGFFALLYREFMLKIERLKNLDEDNEAFRRRLAETELQRSKLEQENIECHEESRAEEIKTAAKEEGGTEASRTIASLHPTDSKLLSKPPEAIFEASLDAFEAGDFETSAKAFAYLADNKSTEEYQTAQTFYLAGVSLYKVANYKGAAKYLERTLKAAADKTLSYAPRALAWQALCFAKLGDKDAEKRVIKELLEKYPNSKEARRLNRNA